MSKLLVFKYIDLILLLACIVVPVVLFIPASGWDALGILIYSYIVAGIYLLLSSVLNRVFLKKFTVLRKVSEIGLIIVVLNIGVEWLLKSPEGDNLRLFNVLLYVIFYGIPVLVILFICASVAEGIWLRKNSKEAEPLEIDI